MNTWTQNLNKIFIDIIILNKTLNSENEHFRPVLYTKLDLLAKITCLVSLFSYMIFLAIIRKENKGIEEMIKDVGCIVNLIEKCSTN